LRVKTKGTNNFVGVLKDAARIEKDFRSTKHNKEGYLLVYFEGWKCLPRGTKGERRKGAKEHLLNLFRRQLEKLQSRDQRWTCVQQEVGGSGGEDTQRQLKKIPNPQKRNWRRNTSFAWGIGLYRFS
jgi:hypothetical protein